MKTMSPCDKIFAARDLCIEAENLLAKLCPLIAVEPDTSQSLALLELSLDMRCVRTTLNLAVRQAELDVDDRTATITMRTAIRQVKLMITAITIEWGRHPHLNKNNCRLHTLTVCQKLMRNALSTLSPLS